MYIICPFSFRQELLDVNFLAMFMYMENVSQRESN